jgi:hypothetical protein
MIHRKKTCRFYFYMVGLLFERTTRLFLEGFAMRKGLLIFNRCSQGKWTSLIAVAFCALTLVTSKSVQAQVPDLYNPPVPDLPGYLEGFRDFIVPSDPSTYVRTYYDEYTQHWVYDVSGDWSIENVWMFKMDLGHTTVKVPIRDDGSYTAAEVYFWANTFGKVFGQLPAFMFENFDALYFVNAEIGALGNSAGGVIIGTQGLANSFQHGWIEEIMVHELAHAAIQASVLGHESVSSSGQTTNWWDYFAARDNDFVSNYAMTNNREDLAETFSVWLYSKFRPYRDYQGKLAEAAAKVPGRFFLLDDLNTRFGWNASW